MQPSIKISNAYAARAPKAAQSPSASCAAKKDNDRNEPCTEQTWNGTVEAHLGRDPFAKLIGFLQQCMLELVKARCYKRGFPNWGVLLTGSISKR